MSLGAASVAHSSRNPRRLHSRATMTDHVLRSIPSVDRVLRDLGETGVPRPVVVEVVRRVLCEVRERREATEPAAVIDLARAAVQRLARGKIQPVINGTG